MSIVEGFPSGQREQIVNLPRKFRWFESTSLHHFSGYGIVAITSAFQAEEAGSIPATRSSVAHVAQLVEHTLGKGEVGSSNLLMSSSNFIAKDRWFNRLFYCLFFGQIPLLNLASLGIILRPYECRPIVQLVEHRFPKPAVGGSSPSWPAIFRILFLS